MEAYVCILDCSAQHWHSLGEQNQCHAEPPTATFPLPKEFGEDKYLMLHEGVSKGFQTESQWNICVQQ